jgi:hypothetical protein
MGQTMNLKRGITGLLLCFVLIGTSSTIAEGGGIGIGVPFYTIDLTETFDKIPGVVEEALEAFELPSEDVDGAVDEVEAALADVPTVLPIPLLGGEIEIGLPFLLVDGLRLGGGVVNEALVLALWDLSGATRPELPFEGDFESGDFEATMTLDPSFSTFVLFTELIKRMDLLIAGIEVGLGVDLIQGRISPVLAIDAPGYQNQVNLALAALHLNGFVWSAFAGHASVGIEIGPPFLRLFARGQLLFPLSQTTGWWGVRVDGWSGSVGVVIRF